MPQGLLAEAALVLHAGYDWFIFGQDGHWMGFLCYIMNWLHHLHIEFILYN